MIATLTDNTSGVQQSVRMTGDNVMWKHFIAIDPTALMTEVMLALPSDDKQKCEVLLVVRRIP